MKRRDRKRIKQQIKSYHCPFGEKRRQTGEPELLKTKTTRERENKEGEQPNHPAWKTLNHYISFLIRLQKLISQWVISIKRGFARQVVKYLRGNLSPQETWQAASARRGGKRSACEEGRRAECCVNGWTRAPVSGTWRGVIALAPRQSHNKLSVRRDKSPGHTPAVWRGGKKSGRSWKNAIVGGGGGGRGGGGKGRGQIDEEPWREAARGLLPARDRKIQRLSRCQTLYSAAASERCQTD